MKITIQKIIYPGKSLGMSEDKIILTDEGLPGETVEITPVQEKKNYIEAKTMKIITPSSSRIMPRCSHYQTCSPYQYIDYKTQLAIKESQLKEIFPDTIISSTPSPKIWGYRNKIKLNITWKSGKASLAYHMPESRDKFIPIDSCCLVSENINKLLASFIETVNKENLNLSGAPRPKGQGSLPSKKQFAFIPRAKALGFLRGIKEVEVRESSKDLMLTIYPPACRSGFASHRGETRSYIEEIILGKTFRIGPESFFQINVPMLEEVLKEMQKSMSLNKKEIIADLYCGIGTFGICLSQYAKKVIGIESAPGNISFLKSNLKLNEIKNFKLYEGPCERLFPSLMTSGIDILILDPPRKGMDNMLCQNIVLSSVKKILYLSCNPITLSRDLKIMSASYAIKTLRFFDFFPQTPHIETLVILEKKQL